MIIHSTPLSRLSIAAWKKMKCALIFAAFFAFYSTVESQLYRNSSASDDEAFKSFKKEFNREYTTQDEEANRFTVFKANRARVLKLNKQYRLGMIAYKCALNQFSDMEREEYRYNVLGRRPDPEDDNDDPTVNATKSRRKRNAPMSFDWRTNLTVTSPRDQGVCGSSFSFAAVAAIEGQFAIYSKKLVKLSEQQVVACSKPNNDDKCRARSLHRALRYFIDTNQPLALETEYPYTGENGQIDDCAYDTDTMASKAKLIGFVKLEPTEDNVLAAVYNQGPVAAKIDADQFTFIFYGEGVYNDQKCSKNVSQTNHWIVIIGYGTTSTGQNFWCGKNSFGITWGISGFFKLARGIDQCCIACNPTYPTIDVDLATS